MVEPVVFVLPEAYPNYLFVLPIPVYLVAGVASGTALCLNTGPPLRVSVVKYGKVRPEATGWGECWWREWWWAAT